MKTKIAMCLMLLTLLASCATKNEVKNKIETEIQTTSLADKSKIHHELHNQLLNSKTLSEVQKKKLTDTYTSFRQEDRKLAEEIEKAKLVLVQTVLKPEMGVLEYNTLKDKIINLNKERLTKTFKSSEEVRKIINKSSFAENERHILEQLYRSQIMHVE